MRIEAAKIKSWVERIERLLEERAAINGDIKDIYAEIKSNEHDAKAIRKLIQRRAQDEGELAEQDALLAAYTDAIAGKIRALEAIKAGASTEAAAKAGGISTGAVSNLRQGMPVQKSRKLNGTPDHDPTTGEVKEESCGATEARNAETNHDAASADGRVAQDSSLDDEQLDSSGTRRGEVGSCCDAEGRSERPTDGRGGAAENADPVRVAPGPQDTSQDAAPHEGVSNGAHKAASPQPAPNGGVGTGTLIDTRTFDEAAGPMPAFLERAVA